MTDELEGVPKRKRGERVPNDILRERNTVGMVAEYWGVSSATVRRLAEMGKLDSIRIGTIMRITREHVLAYEAENSTALAARKDKEHADAIRAAATDRRIAETLRRQRQREREAAQKSKDSTKPK